MSDNISKFRSELAEKFIHILEEEEGEWQKTWLGLVPNATPYNMFAKGGRSYSGYNMLNLVIDMYINGWTDPRFVTASEIFKEKEMAVRTPMVTLGIENGVVQVSRFDGESWVAYNLETTLRLLSIGGPRSVREAFRYELMDAIASGNIEFVEKAVLDKKRSLFYVATKEKGEAQWKNGENIEINPSTGEPYKAKQKVHPSWLLKQGAKASYVEFPMYRDNRAAKNKEKKVYWTMEEYRELKEKVAMGLEEKKRLSDFRLTNKAWKVFNASQIEGIEPYKAPELPKNNNRSDQLIPDLAKAMNVGLENNGGDRCYYSPKEDKVVMPFPTLFISGQAYDFSALHELTHATGHATRLNRDQSGWFGTEAYAFEELIAEIGSCFMAARLHTTEVDKKEIENSGHYVQSWVKKLKEKPEMLIKAVKEAMRASDYMDESLERYYDLTKRLDEACMVNLVAIYEKVTNAPYASTEWVEKYSTYQWKDSVSKFWKADVRDSTMSALDLNPETWPQYYDEHFALSDLTELEAFVREKLYPERIYSIYQIDDSGDEFGFEPSQKVPVAFEGLGKLAKYGGYFDPSNYTQVFSESIESVEAQTKEATLENIFTLHNSDNRPDKETVRSLSVSDIVVVDGDAYYCDSYGWSEIPEFIESELFENEVEQPENELFLKAGSDLLHIYPAESGGFVGSIESKGEHHTVSFDSDSINEVVRSMIREFASDCPMRLSEREYHERKELLLSRGEQDRNTNE